MPTQVAVAPFVVENTSCSVSCAYGRPLPGANSPPHRSTTGRPSRYTHVPAPTSRPSARLVAKASRTGSNPGATSPWTVTSRSGIVDDRSELLDGLHRIATDRTDAEHRDAGVLERGHAFGDVRGRPDERALLQPLGRHLGRRFVLLAVEVQVLDLDRL